MLLDRTLNRAKKEMTVAEAVQAISDPGERDSLAVDIERLMLQGLDTIIIDGPDNAESTLKHPTREGYEHFLRQRWPLLVVKILDGLKAE
jgi:hypothetical protein